MRRGAIARLFVGIIFLPTSFVAAEAVASPTAMPDAYLPTIRCVNGDPDFLSKLKQTATADGQNVAEETGIESNDRSSVVFWEAKQSADFDDAQAAQIGDYVRGGGNLVLTLDEHPGEGPFRLRFMLPTTAWRTTMFHGLQFERSARGTDWDRDLFPVSPKDALSVPYFFTLRPFDTVERGQGRHEPLDQVSVTLSRTTFGGDFKPWDPTFTRPLINRDWLVRVRTDDMGESALLLTGRYGAGSVAVFASSARYLGSEVFLPLLQWMKRNQSFPTSAPLSAEQITSTATVDVEHRTLNVKFTNHQNSIVKGQLTSRILTWENAVIGDFNQAVSVPASGTASIAIPMPVVNDREYQAIQFRDAFIVRSGLLSEDGRRIICEQRTSVDLRPPTNVSVMLDNARALPYPFKAPGYSGLGQFSEHMGEQVMAYAYPPGGAVSATVRVSNGLRNIAPLALVRDETHPGNLSTPAINDECVNADKLPREGMHSYGWWVGEAGKENSLLFTFPAAVTVNQIVLNGNPDEVRNRNRRNPGAVIVETDDGQAAAMTGLDASFQSQLGLVSVPISPAKTQHVRVRFPWIPALSSGGDRGAPALGEIEILGWQGDRPSAVQGKLTVSLIDAMHQTRKTLAEQPVKIDAEQANDLPIHFAAEQLPAGSPEAAFYRLEASLHPDDAATSVSEGAPFMVLRPEKPLLSLNEIHPTDDVSIGFIVTRGFRNAFPLGTGTKQTPGSWETPDDLVWAYERQLKQTPKNTVDTAGQFFVTEANFKHYSTPWLVFPSGENFFDAATPNLVSLAEKHSNWNKTDTVSFGFGDRWDTGPSGYNLYAWPELVQFDEYLASQSLPRLQGKTRGELTSEITAKYPARWAAWEMAHYAGSVRTMREGFAKAGKKLVISAQGLPLVPLKYLDDIAQTVKGFSDDSTWGMWAENIPVTTGREMALMAFNPDWRVSEALVPGYDSAAISTRFWGVVGTTESTRRHFYDPGFRGIITSDGQYRFMNTYGFNMNGSSGYCMTLNDWQEDWRLQERLALLNPDGPVGAGVIVSNAAWDDPDHTTYSGGGMGDSEGDERIHDVAKAIGAFAETGVPISFSANVSCLSKWSGTAPLILLGLDELSPKEIDVITSMHRRGVRMVAVSGTGTIPPAVAAIFGAEANTNDIIATDSTLMIRGAYNHLDPANLKPLLGAIRKTLASPLELPDGVAGYGFTKGKQRYVVLEDWREEPRTLSVRLKADAGAKELLAVNVNDHLPLTTTRDGDDWIVSVPTRPGDGTLICAQEQ